ncbi:pentatricopeptide repeat-containing protein 2, mitochondrial-like [Battus philenor]|uniref:pentatricopeptide repeat-containing protein 2, mitochondrial-like n=1 Tax=Battus philenor TaxID=42288 RepID=UPI0035CF307C
MTKLVNFMKVSKYVNCCSFIPSRSIHITQVSHLYTPAALGIDGYLQSRDKLKEQFSNFTDTFRSKMKEFVFDSKNMVFTEDLKNMVFMAEPVDLELVLNMIKKYNNQNTKFRFGSYILGPVVMRMFHFLNAPKEALQCFEDPANNGFFDQLTSYQILLDLLYNHAMYEEMYRVFEKVQEKQLNMSKFPKYPVVLVLAACYKQNTPKSMEYASKLWSEMISVGTVPLRRASTLFAALALNQGAPHVALECISMQKQNYVTVRNIKAIALAEMGRIDDSLLVLKKVLEVEYTDVAKQTFFEETISKVRSAVEKTDSKYVQELDDIEKLLRERDLVNNENLDKFVCSDIAIVNKTSQNPQPRGAKQNWSSRGDNNRQINRRHMS